MFMGNKSMVVSVTNHGIILYSILPYFHSVKLRDAKRKAYYVALDGTMIMEPVAKDWFAWKNPSLGITESAEDQVTIRSISLFYLIHRLTLEIMITTWLNQNRLQTPQS